MFLESYLEAVSQAAPPNLSCLQRALPDAWIREALAAQGTATVRRRRLPVEQVVWLVIAMGLYRNLSIHECVKQLDLVVSGATSPARSTVSDARARLKSDALLRLFEVTANVWAFESARIHAWRGLSVFGIDGSSLRIADTPENRAQFPGHPSRNETQGSYPLVRMVTLIALRSHLVLAASFGPTQGSETHELHHGMKLRHVIPDDSLTIVDRAYFAAPFLLPLAQAGRQRHWLTRCRKDTKVTVREHLAPGDELVELAVSSEARKRNPDLPKTWIARRIGYQRKGFAPSYLLTSMVNVTMYPAREIVELYHERWELELAYRELKSTVLERQEALRSKSPELVMQELWGLLLAYNLVRREIDQAARVHKIKPTRISFVYALRQIRYTWHICSFDFPGTIPKRLAELRASLKDFLLPMQSRPSYPRAVKIKMSNYPRKKPGVELQKRATKAMK
jgi:Insertion element 4 transposase N-terminal/Transposase DDE domain